MVERYGGQGNDVLVGSAGDDLIVGLAGDDALYGGDGDDTLVIGSAMMQGAILGGTGVDVLCVVSANLTRLSVIEAEILEVGGIVTARADQFELFDAIRRPFADMTSSVQLQLALPGDVATLNLAAELAWGGPIRAAYLYGSAVGDYVTLGGGDDTVESLGGNDSITGITGNDYLDGGLGDDTLIGDEGNDILWGSSGNDVLRDYAGGLVSMSGGAGDDLFQIGQGLFGGGTISGGTGNDTLAPGGADLSGLTLWDIETLSVTMGVTARAAQFEAFDTIRLAESATGRVVLSLKTLGTTAVLDLSDELIGRSVSLTGGADNEALTTGAGEDRVDGGGGNDTLYGGAGADSLVGGLGDDSLLGGTEADTLIGGLGADQLYGEAGDDLLQDFALSTGAIYGGDGNDRVEIFSAGTGTLDGGLGTDVLANASFTSGVDIAGLTLSGFEVLETRGQPIRLTAAQMAGFATLRTGPAFGSVFLWLAPSEGVFDLRGRMSGNGRIWASVITGSMGADTVIGGAGNDTIAGGNGDDVISGGLGRNALTGGNGINTLSYEWFDRSVTASFYTGRTDFAGGYDLVAGFKRLVGSALADTLGGDAGENTLIGGAGNDVIRGYGGPDVIEGGAGDDTMEGGLGADRFRFAAGSGADRIEGFSAAMDRIDLGEFDIYYDQLAVTVTGSDVVITLPGGAQITLAGQTQALAGIFDFGTHATRRFDGGTGGDAASLAGLSGFAGQLSAIGDTTGDSFYGGAGNDTVLAGEGADSLYGGADDDSLMGGGGGDLILGGAGNDLVQGGDGADTLLGEAGDDTILGDMGDVIDGGDGNDLADFAGSAALVIDLTRDVIAVESVIGSGFGDVITGSPLADRITGGAGDDTLYGGAGNDVLIGSEGADRLDGGAGDDTLLGDGADTQFGGAGNDRITASAVVDGGTGTDVLVASGDLTGLSVTGVERLEATGPLTLTATQLMSFASLLGTGALTLSAGGVVDLTTRATVGVQLTGSSAADTVTGGNLADALDGAEGDDSLVGGAGNDTLTGGAGGDTLDGGAGNDVIFADLQDSVIGGAGIDTVVASADYTLGADVENLILTGAATHGTGNGINNQLEANLTLDSLLTGGPGNDVYILHNLGDRIVEVAGEGVDTAKSWVSFNLSSVMSVENLTLLGAENLAARGNNQSNKLVGNAGDNRIEGITGNDSLTGGEGADSFVFSGETGADHILDFSLAQGDLIDLTGFGHGVAQTGLLSAVGGDVRIDLSGSSSVLIVNAVLEDVLAAVIW